MTKTIEAPHDDRRPQSLREAGVLLGRVRTVDGPPTGVARIALGDDGENSIAAVPSANGTATADFVREVGSGGEDAGGFGKVVALQGEIPTAAFEEAFPVSIVDTTGALAARLAHVDSLVERVSTAPEARRQQSEAQVREHYADI